MEGTPYRVCQSHHPLLSYTWGKRAGGVEIWQLLCTGDLSWQSNFFPCVFICIFLSSNHMRHHYAQKNVPLEKKMALKVVSRIPYSSPKSLHFLFTFTNIFWLSSLHSKVWKIFYKSGGRGGTQRHCISTLHLVSASFKFACPITSLLLNHVLKDFAKLRCRSSPSCIGCSGASSFPYKMLLSIFSSILTNRF